MDELVEYVVPLFSRMEEGCEMTKAFSIQFCFGLLAFSSAMEKMRMKVMEPLYNSVKRYSESFEEETRKQYGVDEVFRRIAENFYVKSRNAVQQCKARIDDLAMQWWLCMIFAAVSLFIMVTGLYITAWWLIPFTLSPFVWFLLKSCHIARVAKKEIDDQRKGLETAWEGHTKKTEETEDEFVNKLSDMP